MTDPITRARPFLAQCGACDAGLPMSCTCPQGDFRPVMADLVAEAEEVAELRRDNARLHRLLAAHGIDDPTHAGLSARERAALAAAYERDAEWVCGAFQDASVPYGPYRCTEVHGHPGEHQATIDDGVVARWPR